jgi:hypothetical protein
MIAVQRSHPPTLSPLATAVCGVLEKHTSFPWPVLKAQCRRNGFDPHHLSAATLGALIQDLALAVARFNSMSAGLSVRRDLVALLRAETS